MKPTDINKINRKRFNSIKLLTIGFILCIITPIIGSISLNIPGAIALVAIALTGATFTMVGTLGIVKVVRILKSDSKLREILCDEMYVINSYKSASWGFGIMTGVVVAFQVISIFTTALSAEFVCQFTLLAGLSTYFISFLILQKETKAERNSDK